jgi:two-component system NtrC family sensor kinase
VSTDSRIDDTPAISSQDMKGFANLDLRCLRGYFDGLPDAVLVANSQQRVVYLNPAAEDLLGCSIHPESDCPPWNEILQIDSEKEQRLVELCFTGSEPLKRVPLQLRNGPGDKLSLWITATVMEDETGKFAGCLAILRDIHSDLEAHPEIQNQIATLSSILDSFPTPFFTVSPNLVITHMNELMEKLTGYTREEVIGHLACAKVLCTEQCETEACVLMQAMEHRRPIAGVRRVIMDRQGREIPVVVNASLITDSAGNVIGGFEAVRDISRRVEAEKKIDLLAEMTQEGIRMGEIAGLPKEDVVGMKLSELLSSQHEEMISSLLSEPDPENLGHLCFCSTLQADFNLKDTYRSFETCIGISRVGKSKITYVYLRDLTERIEIEQELRKANSFLTNIIQSSVDGIVVVDTKGNVLIFNQGAERILGYKAAEALGHSKVLCEFYDMQLAREMMRRMRSNKYGPPGKLNPTRISFTGKSGEEVPVNFSAAMITEGGQEIGSVGIFTDLREHERMRRELDDLRENERMRRELEEIQRQLVQAEKIASLGRLAAGVAHEINNPLAGVLIYADMLMKEIGGNQQWRQDLEEIISQTLRCKQIVARLLEFSRQSLDERVVFDVNEIIGHCVTLLQHQSLFHNVEIIQELESDLPQILGNPGELEQVFTNLLINGADAMEGKGKITIISRSEPEAKKVLLEFSDTGPGIPLEIRGKIFEPFFTTKPVGVGTGLGLSVVYGVIQRHSGSIETECPPAGGTTFIIRLPFDTPEVDS